MTPSSTSKQRPSASCAAATGRLFNRGEGNWARSGWGKTRGGAWGEPPAPLPILRARMREKVWPTPAQAPDLPGEAVQPGEPASQRQQETGAAGSGGSQDGPADGTAPSMHTEDGADGHQSLADGTDGVAASNAGPSRGETGAGDGEVRIPLQLSCLHSCGSLTCL